MSNDRSDSLREALAQLSALQAHHPGLVATMERTAELAVQAVRGADMAGVAVLDEGLISTGGASAELVEEIDSFQYSFGEGPCLEAIKTNDVVMIESTTFDRRWPRFAKKTAAKGVGSVLSSPLFTDNRVIGSLNLYAYTARSFDDHDRAAITPFARAAAGVIDESGRAA